MDDLDIKILRILQSDCSLTVSEIGKKVGLSSSPCWKRINKLIKDKIIIKQAAILNQKKLGYNLVAFVSIKTANHSEEWLKNFSKKPMFLEDLFIKITSFSLQPSIKYFVFLKISCSF